MWRIEASKGGIRDKEWQIKLENTIPLIDNLEIGSIFKDKAKEGGDSVMDLVILVCQLLKGDLQELQELVNTMEPVKSWDKG